MELEKEEKKTQGESGDNSIEDDTHKLFVTMHGVTSVDPVDNVKLGPVLTSTVEVEGEPVEALLDTGSPVTIISWEWLLQLLAKKRLEGRSPSEWKAEAEKRLEPTTVVLKNYSGD